MKNSEWLKLHILVVDRLDAMYANGVENWSECWGLRGLAKLNKFKK